MKDEEVKRHPSYGVIGISRVNGHQHFFGSDTKPDSYIDIRIKRAEQINEIGRSWYFGKERLIELRMTNTQFAEMITSLNQGGGIPCTLEFVAGEGKIEQEKEKEYKVDFHKRKMSENAQKVLERLNSQIEDATKSIQKLPKKDQENLNIIFSSLKRDLNQNFPWYMQQYYETMETVAQDIKSNMEADLMHKLQQLGLETLQNALENKQLKLE